MHQAPTASRFAFVVLVVIMSINAWPQMTHAAETCPAFAQTGPAGDIARRLQPRIQALQAELQTAPYAAAKARDVIAILHHTDRPSPSTADLLEARRVLLLDRAHRIAMAVAESAIDVENELHAMLPNTQFDSIFDVGIALGAFREAALQRYSQIFPIEALEALRRLRGHAEFREALASLAFNYGPMSTALPLRDEHVAILRPFIEPLGLPATYDMREFHRHAALVLRGARELDPTPERPIMPPTELDYPDFLSEAFDGGRPSASLEARRLRASRLLRQLLALNNAVPGGPLPDARPAHQSWIEFERRAGPPLGFQTIELQRGTVVVAP